MNKQEIPLYIYRTLVLYAAYPFLRFERGTASYKGKKFSVEIANTTIRRRMGLSFRSRMGEKEGMLIAYPELKKRRIWMMNMKMNIDIIWLDPKGKILHIVHNSKKPDSFLNFEIHNPNVPPKYVLELPSGSAKRYGMKKNERIDLPGKITVL